MQRTLMWYFIFCYNYYPGTWICIWALLVFLCCCNSCMLISVSTLSVTGSINVCVGGVGGWGGVYLVDWQIMVKALGQDSQLVSWETNIVIPPEYEGEAGTPQLWCWVKLIFHCRSNGSQDSLAHILTGLQAGQSGVPVPAGTKLCRHAAFCAMCTRGSVPGGKVARGMKLTAHLHIVMTLRMSAAVPLLSLCVSVAWAQTL
jgi:hypothetical protein